MGGIGSTRWRRVATRPLVERCDRLDVRQLYRDGRLERGYRYRVPVGNGRSVILEALTEAVIVGPVGSTQQIPLTWTGCNYGGRRPWFVCMGCRERAAIVYLWGERFRCRKCHGLAYASQNEDREHRARRRARKLRDALGPTREGGRYPRKPKRMRWRTFTRQLRAIQAAEQEAQALHLGGWMVRASAYLERLQVAS